MRTRRFANTERIRSKERRLHQVNLRRDLALLHSVLPKGVLTDVLHTTTGTTSTIHTPLRALVVTAEETWRVDFAEVPDPTGGFDDVVIPPGKQVGELASDATVSFAGQPVGDYIVYAQHILVDENPETREPPGKYASGTGVFPEHRDFFGHGKPDGTPIPRENFDSTLTPETVSEAVDRLTIAFAAVDSVPANATPLIRVTWNGTSVVSSTVIARTLDFTTLYDHIGARGSDVHAVATTTTAGFMSAADKTKLDAATSSKTASTLAMRDSGGRLRVANPSHDDDAANKGYVDDVVSDIVSALDDHIGSGGSAHASATTSVAGFMSASDKAKLDAATSSKTANTLAMRDPSGRIRVDTPSHDDDAANKGYVDSAVSGIANTLNDHIGSGGNAHANATTSVAGFMSAADKSKLDGATSAPTANRLAMRDALGRIMVAAPATANDAVNKQYVDDTVGTPLANHIGAGGSAHASATTSVAGFMSASDKAKLDAATSSKTASTLAMRDSSGRLRVDTPSHNDDVANKGYVDGAVSGIASTLNGHIGSGGNAHAVATTSVAGFMSASDKAKLDTATSSRTASTLAMRDSGGRLRVANPSHNDDAANKGYVDGKVASLPSAIYWGRTAAGGTSFAAAPPGWTISAQSADTVRITHNLGTVNYSVALTPVGFSFAYISTIGSSYFEVRTLTLGIADVDDLTGIAAHAAFHFAVIVS